MTDNVLSLTEVQSELKRLKHCKIFSDIEDNALEQRIEDCIDPVVLTLNEKEALKSIWLEISRVMEIWEFKPNNSQLAVAMSAAFLLVTK